jgi:hypothetical protein
VPGIWFVTRNLIEAAGELLNGHDATEKPRPKTPDHIRQLERRVATLEKMILEMSK